MKRRTMLSLVALLAVEVAAAAILSGRSYWDAPVSDDLIPRSEAKPAPSFAMPEVATGRVVDVSVEARKRPIVFSFWATWCGPCRAELPHLQKLSEKYRGRVTFYGINTDASEAIVQRYSARHGLTFPMLLDTDSAVHDKYSTGFPLLAVIDTDGKIRSVTPGFDPEMDDHLPKVLDAILSGQ